MHVPSIDYDIHAWLMQAHSTVERFERIGVYGLAGMVQVVKLVPTFCDEQLSSNVDSSLLMGSIPMGPPPGLCCSCCLALAACCWNATSFQRLAYLAEHSLVYKILQLYIAMDHR